MVVVNLYQFEKFAAREGVPREELIENIDIGGPTMIRARQLKNFQDVAVVVSPDQYTALAAEMLGSGGRALRKQHTGDLPRKHLRKPLPTMRQFTARLAQIDAEGRTHPRTGIVTGCAEHSRAPFRVSSLRRKSASAGRLYSFGEGGVASAKQLHGKELSYNNLVDLDAAWHLIGEFENPAAAIIKHTNPCGCAEQQDLLTAYRKALEADPISAFGGVLAFNRELDGEAAQDVSKLFVEAIAAPAFSAEALSILTG